MQINEVVDRQRAFFERGQTKKIAFRRHQLEMLLHAVDQYEDRILTALYNDLGKRPYEGYLTEVGIVRDEIRHVVKRIGKWARPRRVKTPYYHFPAVSTIYPEPYGSALIISPWNYPFQLAISPLAGAIAAGNCAVVKPSEFAPHTAEAIDEIIGHYFDPRFIAVVTGDVETSKALLDEPFDYIFFTGSTQVGRHVMAAAAKHLTPVTLELGGKSPCIVAADADIDSAAKKIASGKFINAGQTCIAPDYVMAHQSVKDRLLKALKDQIVEFYGTNPQKSPDYPRIINEQHFNRLTGLLSHTDIAFGGRSDRQDLYIAPTLLETVDWDHAVMAEEIFGPILPVLAYEQLPQAIEQIRARSKPLALYVFTRDSGTQNRVIQDLSFGGGCVNDTLIHIATPYLPFGGVGASGMGRYHGKASFDTFTHEKSVMKNISPIENPFRFPPYKKSLKLLKKVLR